MQMKASNKAGTLVYANIPLLKDLHVIYAKHVFR